MCISNEKAPLVTVKSWSTDGNLDGDGVTMCDDSAPTVRTVLHRLHRIWNGLDRALRRWIARGSQSTAIASAAGAKFQRDRPVAVIVASAPIKVAVHALAILEILPAIPVPEWPGAPPQPAFDVTSTETVIVGVATANTRAPYLVITGLAHVADGSIGIAAQRTRRN